MIRKEKQMSKHTPGPWRVRNCQTAVLVDVVRNGDAMLIALVADNDSRGDTDTERKMNNAHLIAAAPQMLEALEFSCDVCKVTVDFCESCDVCKIGKAIKAAKGKV